MEIGSGNGFLRRTWPEEFTGKWVQLDSQAAFLKDAKNRFKGDYTNGSAYNLPFADECFDVVCGFGSYDVFNDLEKAINETKRVLKKDGLFFHMIDLHPSPKIIKQDFEKRKVPLRISIEGDLGGLPNIKEVSYIPKEKIDSYTKEFENNALHFLDFEENEKIWEKYAQKVNTDDYFGKKITKILSSNFKDVENGKLFAKHRGRRTEQQRNQEGNLFVFINENGDNYTFLNPIHYNGFKHGLKSLFYPSSFIHTHSFAIYTILYRISQKIAEIFEPSCLEISIMKYVKARK